MKKGEWPPEIRKRNVPLWLCSVEDRSWNWIVRRSINFFCFVFCFACTYSYAVTPEDATIILIHMTSVEVLSTFVGAFVPKCWLRPSRASCMRALSYFCTNTFPVNKAVFWTTSKGIDLSRVRDPGYSRITQVWSDHRSDHNSGYFHRSLGNRFVSSSSIFRCEILGRTVHQRDPSPRTGSLYIVPKCWVHPNHVIM